MKLQKITGLLLILLLVLALSISASAETITLSIAHDNNPGDPLTEACNYWAEILKERSGGTMELITYPSGQLGSKNDLIDQMYAGEPIMVVVNPPYVADRGVPDMGILQAPYLIENWEAFDKLKASVWWSEQMEKMRGIGMQVVADNWQYGVRNTLTVKPVKSPDDLKGMKIRTQNSTIHVEGFACMGATPTPMTLSEVYTSLQQGIIDGLENPISVLYSGKFQEIAKNLVLDGHIYDLSMVVIGTSVFDKLTPEQQKLLVDTGIEAGIKHNELAEIANEECLKKMQEEGVAIQEVDFGAFRDAAKSFYENKAITEKWTPNLYNTIIDIINK